MSPSSFRPQSAFGGDSLTSSPPSVNMCSVSTPGGSASSSSHPSSPVQSPGSFRVSVRGTSKMAAQKRMPSPELTKAQLMAGNAAAVASFASQSSNRPALKLFSPQQAKDGALLASAVRLPPFGDLSNPLVGRALSDMGDAGSSAPGASKRLWFRKKSGGSATSLIVAQHELVDDVKLRILERYPTSLQQRCDPADLVLTVPQSSGIRLELQPDEIIVEVMDRYFPEGMKMSDALEVGPSASLWTSPNTATHGSRGNTPRIILQRARSYSNTQSSTLVSLPSGTMHGSVAQTPQSAGNHGSPQLKPGTPIQEPAIFRVPHSPASEHVPHSAASRHPSANSSHSNSSCASSLAVQGQTSGTSSPPLVPPASIPPDRWVRNVNSVLLLPRKLPLGRPAAISEFGTRLVPLTVPEAVLPSNQVAAARRGHERNDSGVSLGDETLDDSRNSVVLDYRTSLSLMQLQQMLSPSLYMSQGKLTVVPQINILIVEDNPVNQRILEAFMKRKKVRYAVANNGREALDKWKAGGFHLVLMDIQLPVMTGLEATKEIRRLEIANGIGAFPQAFKGTSTPPAPHEVIKKSAGGFRSPVIIVALTASSDSDDKSEALAAGCNDFLTKPVNFMWLEKKIIEWGCMQALIDFDGWKKWSDDGKESPGQSAHSSRRESLQSQQENPSLHQPSLPLQVQAP